MNWSQQLFAPQSMRTAAMTGWLSRGIMAVSQIYAIRILTTMLGVSGYAAYAIIISLQLWFTLSDFGFGASLQNKLSRHRLRGKSGDEIFTATLLFLSIVSGLLCALVLLAAPFVGPALLRRIPDLSAAQAASAFAIFGVVTVIGTVAGLINRLLYAEHRAHLVYILTAAGNLVGLTLISLLPFLHLKSPLALAIALYNGASLLVTVPLVASRIGTVLASSKARRRIARGWRRVIGYLWKQARHMLFISIIGAVILNIDFIILSQFAPPSQIVSYAIVSRLFAFVMTLFTSVTMAAWPHSAEAIASHDGDKLLKIMLDCLSIGFTLFTVTAAVLFFFHRQLVAILSPHHIIDVPLYLVAASWFYWCTRVWTDTNFLVLQAGGRADLGSRIAVVQVIANCGLELLGAKFYGVGGMLVGLTISFIVTSAWYLPIVVSRKFLRVA